MTISQEVKDKIDKSSDPKSDQLNADDLFSGPMTVTITGIGYSDTYAKTELHLAEKKPYRICTGMKRLLDLLWGRGYEKWIGRKLTLYRDPDVKYGGELKGGIRISHASHIEVSVTSLVTVSRNKRHPHTIHPIVIQQPSFLDKWRAQFGGAASDVVEAAKAIAGAYTAMDIAASDSAEAMVDLLPLESTDEDHLKSLRAFVAAVRSELSV